MTTSSADSSSRPPLRRADPRAGFTLVEVLITSTIGAVIMVGLLATFGLIGRTCVSLYHYTDMEEQARRGLETFSEDTRMASAITWTDNTHIALTVPHVGTDSYSNTITYWWDNTSGSSTYHYFRRTEVDTDSSGTTTTTTTTDLIKNVQSFQFDRWQAGGATGVQATSDANTDQLQIHLTLRKQGSQWGTSSTAIVAATNLVVSARYILRNKL